MTDIIIETERLILRQFKEDDAEALSAVCNQEYILKWMPDWKGTVEETRGLIKWFQSQYAKASKDIARVVLAVTVKESGEFIGVVGIGNKEEVDNEIEIAYFVSEEHCNKGYISEAARAMTEWVFTNLHFDYLMAIVEPDNVPSQRVLEKCGFTKLETKMILNSGETKEKPYFYYRICNNEGTPNMSNSTGKSYIPILAGLYNADESSITKSTTSGNYNQAYEFTRLGEWYVLRVSPPGEDRGHHDRVMRYLERHAKLGSPVVRPVVSKRGLLVEEIDSDKGTHLVTVFRKESGRTYELIGNDTISEGLFQTIGRGLAVLHNNSAVLQGEFSPFPHWHERDNCFNILEVPGESDPGITGMYRKYRDLCLQAGRSGTNYGLVHGDIHFSNIILDQNAGRSVFCDFDDACQGQYAMDMAMVVFDLAVVLECLDKPPKLKRQIATILQGYNDATKNDRIHLVQMEGFLKLLETSLYLQFGRYCDGEGDENSWLRRFGRDRRRRITEDIPYLDV